MIRREKHIEIRLRVLEQLDEMLGLVKTGDGFLRTSQSDNRPIDHRLQGRFTPRVASRPNDLVGPAIF